MNICKLGRKDLVTFLVKHDKTKYAYGCIVYADIDILIDFYIRHNRKPTDFEWMFLEKDYSEEQLSKLKDHFDK